MALIYFASKTGSNVIWDNFNNYNNDQIADFGGNEPYGPNLDTLEIIGRDKLKRKTDEGYLIINSGGNQLTFVRDIGISGGGLSHHAPGQGPLPGYTWPAVIVFDKIVLMEEKGGVPQVKKVKAKKKIKSD